MGVGAALTILACATSADVEESQQPGTDGGGTSGIGDGGWAGNQDGSTTCPPDSYDLDGQSANGCECKATPAGTGSSCAWAIDVGALSDVAGTVTTRQGNAPAPGREIWYAFKATDDTDTAGDEFHVDIRFLTNPGSTYKMDVYRGGCPGAAGDAGAEQIAKGESANTDWFVDFDKGASSPSCTTQPGCGEGNCVAAAVGDGGSGVGDGAAAPNECHDDTAEFRVRIYNTGIPTCATYDLELSNGKY